jgi:hypothetical protein
LLLATLTYSSTWRINMRVKLLLLVVLSSFPMLAFALFGCNSMMSLPCGWYAEGNIGYTHLSGRFSSSPSASHDNKSQIGGNINVGYKLIPYLAAEVGYFQFPSTSIDVGNTRVATLKHYAADLALKGIVPVEDTGFEVFAKLGVGYFRSTINIRHRKQILAHAAGIHSTSRSRSGLFLGLGGQYYFMPELAVVLQWQRIQGSSSNGTADLYSIGLSWLVV